MKSGMSVICVVFALIAVSSATPAADIGGDSPFRKINIIGDPLKNGIFDVSVEYGKDGVGWLAYSRVELPKYVSTHLARSMDRGKTWHYVKTINKSFDHSLRVRGRTVPGVWRYETSSLLYDPGDIPARRWKLFVQRYFNKRPHKSKNSLFGQGWIEVRYARDPAGRWSRPKCLFGKISKHCNLKLNSLHRDLRAMSFYSEIGSLYHQGEIYLSLDASATPSGLGKWRKRKIILISSADHGKSWRFVGTLTNFKDAKAFGYLVFTGSSLVKRGNRLFFLVTPSGARGFGKKNRAHDGTFIIEFSDIRRALLKRDAKGKLIVSKRIKPTFHSGGLSDYHQKNIAGGLLFSEINPKAPPDVFKTYSAGVVP